MAVELIDALYLNNKITYLILLKIDNTYHCGFLIKNFVVIRKNGNKEEVNDFYIKLKSIFSKNFNPKPIKFLGGL